MLIAKCDFCGEERPDDRISVKSRPVAVNGKVIDDDVHRNFCNDKEECRIAANRWWLEE